MYTQTVDTQPTIRLAVTEGIFSIQPSEIIRMEARSNYTFIYFTNRKPILIAKVLKEFENKLCGCGFIRTHRAHLINSQYIHHIGHDGKIVMQDDFMPAVSRRLKTGVLKKLNDAA